MLLFPLLLTSCFDQGPPPNLLLITVDTVRADHIGAYGYAKADTPTIDALAARGTLFETAVSVAPITMPTHSSIMTGAYPTTHGVRDNGSFVLEDAQTTLAERAQAAGYDTAAVVSAFVLDGRFGLNQGFRIYDDDLSGGDQPALFMYRELRAEQSVDKAIELITKELSEPWMVWLHLFDAHADYEPPPPYDVLFVDQPYDGEIAYMDRELGRLTSKLKAMGLQDRTVVSLLADHGDSLGDHGESTHGIFIYRSTTHIPWIVAGPDVRQQRVSGIASQVDVAPTLATLMGLPSVSAEGTDLSSTLWRGSALPKREVYMESLNPRLHFGWHELRGLDGGDTKYIDAPKRELYDLTKDPAEATNLAESRSADVEGFANRMATRIGDDDVAKLHERPVDSETVRMLDALGYVSHGSVGNAANLPDPKDVAHRWAELQICQALVRATDHPRAIACLAELLDKDPANWTAMMSFGRVLVEADRAEEALAVLTRALEQDPTNVQTIMALAGAHRHLEQFDAALELLNQATKLAPDNPQPWSTLGDIHQDAGRSEEAVRGYGEALRRDDRHVEAYVGLSNTFFRDRKFDKAEAYIDRGIELDATHQPLWYNRGVLLGELDKPTQAEAAYRKSIELVPNHAMSHNNLGSILNRRGDSEGAKAAYRAAMEADPDHVESRYNLATLLMDSNPVDAAKLLQDVVRRAPHLVPAWLNLGHVLGTLGQVDLAVQAYRGAIAQAPNSSGAWLAIAGLELRRGNAGAAKEAVQQAVTVGGDEAQQRVQSTPALAKLLNP